MLGLMLDLVLGGLGGLGRLPGPDRFFALLFSPLASRLDKKARGATALIIRSILLQLLFLPLIALTGLLLNKFISTPYAGAPITAILLALSIRFRPAWDLFKAASTEANASADARRTTIETLVLSFSRDWCGGFVLFALGGFALLLPYRFLVVAARALEVTTDARQRSVFARGFTPLFDILALPGALWAGIIFALCPIILPGTQLSAVKGFAAVRLRGILSRVIPLSVVAYALNFSFAAHGEGKTGQRNWIGPHDGRAKLGPADMRTSGKLMLAAAASGIITMTMAALLVAA